MKKFYIFLVALFIINGAMAQGSFHALSMKALAQIKHPTSRVNENVQDKMHNAGMKTSKLNSKMILGKDIKLQTHSPQDLIQIYDSIYNWVWDSISAGWTIDSKTIKMVYNAHNNETSELDQSWDGSAWINYMQFTFAYDANNNLTNSIWQSWNGSVWVNYRQNTYSYDANNNEISYLWQIWDGSTWENYSKNTYTYDANNNMTNELDQHWYGSAWVNQMQEIIVYNASNNMTSYLFQIWNGSAWVNSFLGTLTYDANNNMTYALHQTWDGSAWVNQMQDTDTYDANNNMVSELDQSWDGSDWVNSALNTYTYDANNFQKSFSWKWWNSTGTKVTVGDSSYYYYHTVVGLNDPIASDGNITFYPNPASNQISIQTSAISGRNKLTISNLNGQELITRQITEPSTSLDISSLPSGVFIVKVIGEKGLQVGRFIKN